MPFVVPVASNVIHNKCQLDLAHYKCHKQ